MSSIIEEQLLEREARRLGISVVQLRMAMVMRNPDGSDLMQQIVQDNRGRNIHERSGILPRAQAPTPPKQGSGWQEPKPLGPPDGIKIIDHMCDVADEEDRIRRMRELGIEPADAMAGRREVKR
jgi:hypothetical protein